ncbi:hypothetical protein C0431_09480 [bacterium]|nr:hypothetical protein [bacterium]
MKTKQLLFFAIGLGLAQTAFSQANEVLIHVRPFMSYKVEIFYRGEPHPIRTVHFNSWFNYQYWFKHSVEGFRSTFYRVTGAGRVDQTDSMRNLMGIGKVTLRAGQPFLDPRLSGDITWSW